MEILRARVVLVVTTCFGSPSGLWYHKRWICLEHFLLGYPHNVFWCDCLILRFRKIAFFRINWGWTDREAKVKKIWSFNCFFFWQFDKYFSFCTNQFYFWKRTWQRLCKIVWFMISFLVYAGLCKFLRYVNVKFHKNEWCSSSLICHIKSSQNTAFGW